MPEKRWVLAHTRKHHGLGNRVRAVLGTRVLARTEGRQFAYVWRTGKFFGARMDELWEFDEPTLPWWVSQPLAARYPFRDNKACDWVDDDARTRRVWQVRTAHALVLPTGAPDWTEDLRALRVAPPVESRLREFHSQHLSGRPFVGVMVRTHPLSHQATLAASPIEWYIDRLSRVRRSCPETTFFVSADTTEGLERLQGAVPGCVGLAAKGDYNSRQGLQSSVADLYLLASSAHIIGPHFSSFTELARDLGGPEIRLETSRTQPQSALESGTLSQAIDPTTPHLRQPVELR